MTKDEEAKELLCAFLGKLPATRDITLTCDAKVLKSWSRDAIDSEKVTLVYMVEGANEGDEQVE